MSCVIHHGGSHLLARETWSHIIFSPKSPVNLKKKGRDLFFLVYNTHRLFPSQNRPDPRVKTGRHLDSRHTSRRAAQPSTPRGTAHRSTTDPRTWPRRGSTWRRAGPTAPSGS